MKIELDTLLENEIIESGKITELVCNGQTIWKGLSDDIENFAEAYSFVKFNRDIKDSFNKPTYSIEVKSNYKQLVEAKEEVEYGVPEEKKFPLDSKEHVVSAIKFFNYVKPEYEQQLADALITKMQQYEISNDHVGEDNKLKKYLSSLTEMSLHIVKKNKDGTTTKTELPKSPNGSKSIETEDELKDYQKNGYFMDKMHNFDMGGRLLDKDGKPQDWEFIDDKTLKVIRGSKHTTYASMEKKKK